MATTKYNMNEIVEFDVNASVYSPKRIGKIISINIKKEGIFYDMFCTNESYISDVPEALIVGYAKDNPVLNRI